MKTRLSALSIAFLALPLIAAAQGESALRQQHEKQLEAARSALASLAANPGAGNAGRAKHAAALRDEAVALNLLGRPGEALGKLRQAAELAPLNLNIRMETAVALDYLGRHDEAAQAYDDLLLKIQSWRAERVKALKAGVRDSPSAQDEDVFGVSLAITENAALNNVLRGRLDQALMQFAQIHETRSALAGPDMTAGNAAAWRVWLTARSRAVDGLPPNEATRHMIASLRTTTPCHDELLRLWGGKGHWQKILEAINGMDVSAAEKEKLLTGARFFAAGYYRYIKRDTATALELLDAAEALPFDGCVERLFIRREIAELRK